MDTENRPPLLARLAVQLPKNVLFLIGWLFGSLHLSPWLLLPAAGFAVAVVLGAVGFIIHAPLPTPIARATGRTRSKKP